MNDRMLCIFIKIGMLVLILPFHNNIYLYHDCDITIMLIVSWLCRETCFFTYCYLRSINRLQSKFKWYPSRQILTLTVLADLAIGLAGNRSSALPLFLSESLSLSLSYSSSILSSVSSSLSSPLSSLLSSFSCCYWGSSSKSIGSHIPSSPLPPSLWSSCIGVAINQVYQLCCVCVGVYGNR